MPFLLAIMSVLKLISKHLKKNALDTNWDPSQTPN